MPFYRRSARVVALALSFLSLPLLAHDLYLIPARFFTASGDLLAIELHNGDSFPESEVSPVLERVADFQLVTSGGARPVHNARVTGKVVEAEVRAPSGAEGFVVTARTVPHAFELPAREFNSYLQEEGLATALAWRRTHDAVNAKGRERYAKYAKALVGGAVGSNRVHTQPVGFALEFVPHTSPYDAPADGKVHLLAVTLLLHGKPAPDVQVEVSWAGNTNEKDTHVLGRTGREGQFMVPLVKPGLWRLHAVYMERCAETNVADWESSWASLTFATK